MVAFVWELTKETINSPLGCLQDGTKCHSYLFCPYASITSFDVDFERSLAERLKVPPVRFTVRPSLQGYLAHKKQPLPRTLQ